MGVHRGGGGPSTSSCAAVGDGRFVPAAVRLAGGKLAFEELHLPSLDQAPALAELDAAWHKDDPAATGKALDATWQKLANGRPLDHPGVVAGMRDPVRRFLADFGTKAVYTHFLMTAKAAPISALQAWISPQERGEIGRLARQHLEELGKKVEEQQRAIRKR